MIRLQMFFDDAWIMKRDVQIGRNANTLGWDGYDSE